MTSAKVALSCGLIDALAVASDLRRGDVAAVDAARRVRAHDLLRLLDLDRHVLLRAVGEGVLLEDQRLIDRREDGARQGHFPLPPQHALDAHDAQLADARDDLVARRRAVQEEARRGVVGEDEREVVARLVRREAQHGEDDVTADEELALVVHAVGDDDGDAPAAHLDVILMRLALLDAPRDAAVSVQTPARLLRARRGLQDEDAREHPGGPRQSPPT